MANFPSYLKLQAANFGEDYDSAVMRTTMENGFAKQLRTKTRVLVKRDVRYLAKSLADYNAFKVWFFDEINAGTDWFGWFDPVKNAAVQARIADGKFSGAIANKTLNYWDIKMTIETWQVR